MIENIIPINRKKGLFIRQKKLLTLLCLTILFFTYRSKAIIYTVGTGTIATVSNAITPFATLYEDNRTQYLYLASELTAAGAVTGSIQSIGFNFTSLGSPSPTNVNISIGTTSATTLSGLVSGLTASYTAATVTPVLGWNTYLFTTPFSWNGTDNIIVEVCRDNNLWSSNYGVQTTNLGTGKNQTYGAYDDGITGCPAASSYVFTGTSTIRPNCQFDITPAAPCAGMPSAGTAAASGAAAGGTVCPNVSFTLSATGATTAGGLTYDWQANTGSGWAPTGATNINYVVSSGITVSTDYRLIITCTASNSFDTSNTVSVAINPFISCYCTPTSSCGDEGIVNVTMGTLNNSSTKCAGGGYSDYKGLGSQVALTQGQQIAISVTDTINSNPASTGVWIDYDHSGMFDASEFTHLGTATAFSGNKIPYTFTANINIPAAALTGVTAMRVRSANSSTAVTGSGNFGPCNGSTTVFGEYEDYLVTINPGTPCNGLPTGGTLSSTLSSSLCSQPFTISASGYTAGTGLFFQWQESTDNMNFANHGGAASNYMDLTVPGFNHTMYYRLEVTCINGGNFIGYSDTVTVAFTPFNTFPWIYDVETQNTTTNSSITNDCWSSSPAGPTTAYRWDVDAGGGTPSSSTGPTGAKSGIKYYYTEASSGFLGDSAMLVTPAFDISSSGTSQLEFYYHMFGSNMGKLIIQVENGSGWVSLDSLVGQQQTASANAWLQRIVPLTGYTGIITVRFVGIKGNGFRGDMSLDDIMIASMPLSIKLHTIHATNTGTSNRIDWNTSSEERTDKFELERSVDGMHFTTIHRQPANGTPGRYTYLDQEAAKGINHYRLRMTDASGTVSYSKIVAALVQDAGFDVSVYPNPVSQDLTVQVNGPQGTNATVQVTDITGKAIKTIKMNGNTETIDMSGLASGIYLIKYADAYHAHTVRVSKH